MKRYTTVTGVAIAILMIAFTIKPQTGFALFDTAPEVWISPISLSSNSPGIEFSRQSIELLVVRTELSYQELEKLGIRVGLLEEEDVRKLLDSISELDSNRYIRFFDIRFGESSEISTPKPWQQISEVEPFILDAISLGDFDNNKQTRLRRSLKTAAENGQSSEQISARSQAYQLLFEARQTAARKARAYRKLFQSLDLELEKRVFENTIGMVVDIRTSGKRPTIAPVSLVTIQCDNGPRTGVNLVFKERKRACDDVGICRVESIATPKDNPDSNALFNQLRDEGRRYLDGCIITTKMLIDGSEIVRTLPGKYTSTSSRQP